LVTRASMPNTAVEISAAQDMCFQHTRDSRWKALELENLLGVWAGTTPHMGSRRSEFAHLVQERANEDRVRHSLDRVAIGRYEVRMTIMHAHARCCSVMRMARGSFR
jgi:hypothetical protein